MIFSEAEKFCNLARKESKQNKFTETKTPIKYAIFYGDILQKNQFFEK